MRCHGVVIALLVVVSACDPVPDDWVTEPPDIFFRTDVSSRLFSMEGVAFAGGERLVIRDRDSWLQAWYQVFSVLNPRPVPEVDFATESVLLVAGGALVPEGTRIDSVGVLPDGAHVLYFSTTRLGPRCPPPPPVVAWPIVSVRVPAVVNAAEWREEVKTLRC